MLIKTMINPNMFNRFEVISVDRTNNMQILKMKHFSSDGIYECHLSGSWCRSDVSIGDIVNVRSDQFSDNIYTVDNQHGLITIGPDNLITSTLLSSSIFCMRKAWLSEKFKGYFMNPMGKNVTLIGNKFMLIGTMVHNIFQIACEKRSKSIDDLQIIMDSVLQKPDIISECILVNISAEELANEVKEYLPSILRWLQKYVLYGPGELDDEPLKVQINTIKDIEDNIWAPSLGVKGKVDASCQVTIHGQMPRKILMPLELKTGRASFSSEHMGQVSLYSMMMKERGSNECDSGLLLYLKNEPRMRSVQIKRPVEKALIERRNELAYFLSQPLDGPDLRDSEYYCPKCDHVLDCCLMAKSFEPEKVQSSPLFGGQLIPSNLAHLDPIEIEFFKRWISLVSMEVEEIKTERQLIFWSEHSSSREAKGLGLSDLVIDNIDQECVVLKRSPDSVNISLFNSSAGLVGERVAISVDETCETVPTKVAIFVGWVSKMDSLEIEVIVDRKVRSFDREQRFRVDIVNSSSIFSINYDNLLILMDTSQQSKKLRDLIVFRQPPKYVPFLSSTKKAIATNLINELNLNLIQQEAVLDLLSVDDYMLIRGTPGSGKTSTIVAMVKLLLRFNKSVLISSHTHAAVDNILCKLKDSEIDFVRFGSDSRIHPLIRSHSAKTKTKDITETTKLYKFYQDLKVAGVTCMGVLSDPLLTMKTFDFCIIDEATQILFPANLGPLFFSSRFILVGDENQLPPVVQSKKARVEGLGESLFTMLLETTQSISLPIQYRMNREIMSRPSQLFYRSTLKCGSEQIATAVIPKADGSTGLSWLDRVLSHDLSHSFIFLNTDHILDWGTDDPDPVTNPMEVLLCKRIVDELTERNRISPTEIGIISPFQRQVSLLKREIDDKNILISTIDQFQGKERMVVLFSLVKRKDLSDRTPSKDEILSDGRRLNVALTRAAQKLVLLGSRSLLNLYEPFNQLFKLMDEDLFVPIP
ncbi:DNA replication ATP-dependent helicase/nuclease DNA2-like [Brevipalpus obovatus]|uniref:DNA replication ATP-dependent helicase/nuclease DNA2-like n=1 Tax=Brevipalpus obovatus TaxID=246614 RepID=UPI003D9E4608